MAGTLGFMRLDGHAIRGNLNLFLTAVLSAKAGIQGRAARGGFQTMESLR
jgi:hypothetical protein